MTRGGAARRSEARGSTRGSARADGRGTFWTIAGLGAATGALVLIRVFAAEAATMRRRQRGVSTRGMEFEVYGDGPRTALFIPGGPGSELASGVFGLVLRAQFRPYVEAGYTVWNVTRRRNMPAGHSVADMAADHAGFISDHLGGRADLVVGESYGGLIAQYLAANHPDAVGRVVLALAAVRVTDEGADLDLRWARARAEGRFADAGEAFLEYLLPGEERAPLRRRLGPLAGRLFARSTVPPGDLLVEGEAEAAFDATEALGRIRAPVLVLCGDRDEFFSREDVHRTADLIPACSVTWYPGKTHLGAGMSGRLARDVLAWVGPPDDGRPSPPRRRPAAGQWPKRSASVSR